MANPVDGLAKTIDAVKDLVDAIRMLAGLPPIHIPVSVGGGTSVPDLARSLPTVTPAPESLPKDMRFVAHAGERVEITPASKSVGQGQSAPGGDGGGNYTFKIMLDGREMQRWISESVKTGHIKVDAA